MHTLLLINPMLFLNQSRKSRTSSLAPSDLFISNPPRPLQSGKFSRKRPRNARGRLTCGELARWSINHLDELELFEERTPLPFSSCSGLSATWGQVVIIVRKRMNDYFFSNLSLLQSLASLLCGDREGPEALSSSPDTPFCTSRLCHFRVWWIGFALAPTGHRRVTLDRNVGQFYRINRSCWSKTINVKKIDILYPLSAIQYKTSSTKLLHFIELQLHVK